MYFFGWLVVFISFLMINHFELFGLKQVVDNLQNRQLSPATFKVNFLYRMVRQPIMPGFIIAFWATPIMTLGHFIFSIITTMYILMAVRYLEEKDLEEKDLLKLYGEQYEKYQKKVPMIVPFASKTAS